MKFFSGALYGPVTLQTAEAGRSTTWVTDRSLVLNVDFLPWCSHTQAGVYELWFN